MGGRWRDVTGNGKNRGREEGEYGVGWGRE